MNFLKMTVVLALCLLVIGCSSDTNTNSNTSNVNTKTTTTTTTNTTNATATANTTTQPSPGASKSPEAAMKADTAEKAAAGLFAAWKTKDRVGAMAYATEAAITKLYKEGSPGGLQFQGCNKEGSSYLCAYSYEGGSMAMTVKGSEAAGYKVEGIQWTAD